jgi:glycosyltransferase involved in cell wall biosynthesis
MKQPLVSIIIPSQNQEGFIRAIIETVLDQDYPKIEYITIDGGSPGETASITFLMKKTFSGDRRYFRELVRFRLIDKRTWAF